ncbi:MAG: type I methionyl aminopeptidase, partial [Pseudonocardia sp.]|nr:type I methionyl aminopeptidase [Pseudonocardia sp.]
MPARTLLTPGTVAPIRSVPAHIPRPEYVGRKAPARSTEPWVQDAGTVELMRHAGKIAADEPGDVDVDDVAVLD